MKIYLLLFLEFFKTGLFSIGGGYATMPFLYQFIDDYGWYSSKQLSDMIAISILTPGPVGINMATFAGFQTTGLIGAITASVALVMPSYIIVIFISELLEKYKDNFYVKTALASLRPVGCGLLTVLCINLCTSNIKNIYSLLLLTILFILSFNFRKNPILYFVIGSISGVVLHFCLPSAGI